MFGASLQIGGRSIVGLYANAIDLKFQGYIFKISLFLQLSLTAELSDVTFAMRLHTKKTIAVEM